MASLFSGNSPAGGLLDKIGISLPTPNMQVVDPSSCMIALDGAKQEIANKNAQLAQQKQSVDYVTTSLPDLNTKLDAINKELQSQQSAQSTSVKNTNIPTFYISIGIFVLLLFLGLIYNQLVTKNIVTTLEKNGIFDALAKAFKKGDFDVMVGDENKKFSDYWKFLATNILTIITRGRFVLLIAIYLFILALNIFLYAIVFRGQDAANCFKICAPILAIVLGLTFIFVNNQTMNNPFENVVGYQYIKGRSLTDAVTHIFKHKYFESKHAFPGTQIYYDFIINTLNVKNFPTVLEEIYRNSDKYDFKINTDEDGITKSRVEELYKLVIMKNSVGHVCWMFFGSLVGTIISLKYLFASGMM
jgi:hypothetical protein